MRTFLLILLISIVGCSEDPIIEPLYEDLIIGNWQNVSHLIDGESFPNLVYGQIRVEENKIEGIGDEASYTINGDSITLYYAEFGISQTMGIVVDSEKLELSEQNTTRIYNRIE